MLWRVISRCQRRNYLFTSLLTTAEVKDGGDLSGRKVSSHLPAYRSKPRVQMLLGYEQTGSESLKKPTYIPCLQNPCLRDLIHCRADSCNVIFISQNTLQSEAATGEKSWSILSADSCLSIVWQGVPEPQLSPTG